MRFSAPTGQAAAQAGADLVGYSGGKCLRGPQSAGILIGREDLVRAAWVQSAPHHGFGRSMKVGKEEIVGVVTALELYLERDHEAEAARWEAQLRHIEQILGIARGDTACSVDPVLAFAIERLDRGADEVLHAGEGSRPGRGPVASAGWPRRQCI